MATSASKWWVVMAAFCGVMVSFGSLLVFTFSIFVKPLSAEFSWSRESISAAFGIAAMTVAVVSPFLGHLLDRYGPRRVVVPCMITFGLLFGSLGLLTPSLVHLYAVFCAIGVVGNGTTQMGYGRAVSSWFDKQRGLALALVVSGVGIGSIVFPPLVQYLIGTRGWRAAYFTLGALILILGVPLTAIFVREKEHGPARQLHTPGSSIREGLRSRAFWFICGSLFLASMAVNGAITHFSPLLTDRGVDAGTAALAVSALGGFSLTGRLITGHFLDRYFGPRVSFVLLLGVTAGIIVLSKANSAGSALLAAALIGLGMGGEADVTPYLLTRYFGLKSFSSLYGFTWTAYAIAGGAGPILMGKVFDATGSYTQLLLILSAMVFASGLFMAVLPKYPADIVGGT